MSKNIRHINESFFKQLLSRMNGNDNGILLLSSEEKPAVLEALAQEKVDYEELKEVKEDVFSMCTRIELETVIKADPDSQIAKEIKEYISSRSIKAEKFLRELVALEADTRMDIEFDSDLWLNYQDPDNNYTILQNALHIGVSDAFFDELVNFYGLSPEAISNLLEAKDYDGNTEFHHITRYYQDSEPNLQSRQYIMQTIFRLLKMDTDLINHLLSIKNNNGQTALQNALMYQPDLVKNDPYVSIMLLL